MDIVEIKVQLEWILHQIQSVATAFLIGDVIPYKEYAVQDVHDWASEHMKDGEVQRIYNKIKDTLEGRIFKAANSGEINVQVAIKALGEFFVRGSGADKDGESVGQVRIEIIPWEVNL